ncbi:(2Fe-2S)-binding protein [bacterium]|nr:(2Fe-2S)-binding protein [bacterium]
MAKVTFVVDGEETVVEVAAGDSLAEAGVDAGLEIEHACGFNCRCTTCRGLVTEGEELVAERNEAEMERLEMLRVPPAFRLTCQCLVQGEGEIRVEYPG